MRTSVSWALILKPSGGWYLVSNQGWEEGPFISEVAATVWASANNLYIQGYNCPDCGGIYEHTPVCPSGGG